MKRVTLELLNSDYHLPKKILFPISLPYESNFTFKSDFSCLHLILLVYVCPIYMRLPDFQISINNQNWI